MSKEIIHKRIITIIKKVMHENDLEINIEVFDDNTNLIDDLGFDSFNLAQLTVEIESEFGIDIFENGLVRTLKDIFKQF